MKNINLKKSKELNFFHSEVSGLVDSHLATPGMFLIISKCFATVGLFSKAVFLFSPSLSIVLNKYKSEVRTLFGTISVQIDYNPNQLNI